MLQPSASQTYVSHSLFSQTRASRCSVFFPHFRQNIMMDILSNLQEFLAYLIHFRLEDENTVLVQIFATHVAVRRTGRSDHRGALRLNFAIENVRTILEISQTCIRTLPLQADGTVNQRPLASPAARRSEHGSLEAASGTDQSSSLPSEILDNDSGVNVGPCFSGEFRVSLGEFND